MGVKAGSIKGLRLRGGPPHEMHVPGETQAVGAQKCVLEEQGVRAPGLEPGFRRWQRPVITTTLRSLVIPPTEQGFKRLSAGGVESFSRNHHSMPKRSPLRPP